MGEALELGPYLLGYNDINQGIYTGDAKVLCEEIPDESIDLIFTDPVYQNMDDYAWLAEMATRKLVENGALLTFYGIGYTEETYRALRKGGRPITWMFPILQIGQTQRIHPRVFNHWYGLLWAGGNPRITIADVTRSHTATLNGGHKWRKNPAVAAKFVDAFCPIGGVTLDPFTGGGTVPAACKMLSRNYLAFEIEPQTATIARKRLIETPIPLPNITTTQLDLNL